MPRFFRQIESDDAGSPVVEFALAAPVVAMMVAGVIEFGMVMFTTTLMESAMRDAARYGITGAEMTGQSRIEKIIQIVSERTLGLVDMNAADVQVLVYPGFSDIGQGEAFVDGNNSGAYDAGETFTDSNGNGVWDADMGVSGAGGAGDVVVYRMSYDWPLLTPLAGTVIGQGGTFPLTASIAVRNEPWEGSTNGGGQP